MCLYKKPSRAIERAFIHVSSSSYSHHDDVSVIEAWHKERWPKGCADYCGYHFFIKRDGTVQESRPLEVKPIAQGGHNSHTVAICLHGKHLEDFTQAQYESLKLLCEQINVEHNGTVTFHGHCEVSPKPCPVFDYRQVLKLDEFGVLRGDGIPRNMPTLKKGSKGNAVKHLQRLLGLPQAEIDGVFGDGTRSAVIRLQEASGLVPDGIVGRNTWSSINIK